MCYNGSPLSIYLHVNTGNGDLYKDTLISYI